MSATLRAFQPSTPPRADEQEFAFAAQDFERVRQLIYDHAGINLHANKHAMVYSRLSRRLRETGHRSFADYLGWLQSNSTDARDEWQQFVNGLTTNLTSFFRESHHFDSLAEDLRERQLRDARIWCSASSTGEEPYSIAMVIEETFGSASRAEVVASDIDTTVLATAQRAVYDADARGLSPQRLQRHFLRGKGANAGRIRVRPAVAQRVTFRTVNLIDARWNLGEPFDIVFCRNVMIYFDAATQRRVLERLHSVLRPEGLLYVGHSENFTASRDLFRLRGKTIYVKV
ncbi:MAG: chemotaxis protein CheR [Burkholderiaceae bacterium]|jgi:chemotaxis protein methyltransferase CheR|nr:chemotaxis protein CheR [Burkholderiaceae bacterium]